MTKTKFFTLLLTLCLLLSVFVITGLTDNSTEPANSSLLGDANGDGNIDTRDVITMRRYIADLDYATGSSSIELSANADMDGDDIVRLYDLFLLRYFIVNSEYHPESSGSESIVPDPSEPETESTEPETDTSNPDTTEPETDTSMPETTEPKEEETTRNWGGDFQPF